MNIDKPIIPKPIVYLGAVLPWIVAIFAVVQILVFRYPLSGALEVESDMTGDSAYIYPFLPAERASSPGIQQGGWRGQSVFDDPVYMTVRVPGPYDKMQVQMTFKPNNQPLVEMGLVQDSEGKMLDLRPFYAEELQADDWISTVSPNGIKGYVKKGLLPDELDRKAAVGLAIWHATATSPVLADDAPNEPRFFDISLRGTHDFWLIPAAGTINMDFKIQDVNRTRKGGSVSMQVTKNGVVVHQDALATGGSADSGYGNKQDWKLRLDKLEPGAYRVRIIGDDDIFIRSVTTTNKHLTIGTRLNIGDVVGYLPQTRSFKTWTTTRHLVAETFHKEGLQELSLGEVKRKISATHKTVRLDRSDNNTGMVEFFSPVGDVRIVADGYFALAPEMFFEPEPRKLTEATHLENEGIVAVLTPYIKTQTHADGMVTAAAVFDLPPRLDTVRLVLSVPGIASRAGSLDITKTKVTFLRPPIDWRTWKQVLLSELKGIWRRL